MFSIFDGVRPISRSEQIDSFHGYSDINQLSVDISTASIH
jgi:hypothetical protein